MKNLGRYTTLDKVWDKYPNGGGEGDYVFIDDVKYLWDDINRTWGSTTVDPGPGGPGSGNIEGDLNVTGRATFEDDVTIGDFVAGSSGAKIYKNGDAEFRNLRVDSLLLIDPETGDYVHLSDFIINYVGTGGAGGSGLDWSSYEFKSPATGNRFVLYDPIAKQTYYTTIDSINEYINERIGSSTFSVIKENDTVSLTDNNVLSSLRVVKEIEQRAISKVKEDTANKLIKFREGIDVGAYSGGTLGGGGTFRMIDGLSHLEVDQLDVRLRATFNEIRVKRTEHIGGELMLTAAGLICNKVEETPTIYRCYFDTKENTIPNYFKAGDLAISKMFNGVSDTPPIHLLSFFWREVTGVGPDFIDLSKTNFAAGSIEPKKGDHIVQLGNLSDPERQNAQILSTVGPRAPSDIQYAGISGFTLEGKERNAIYGDGKGNKLYGKVTFLADNGDEGGIPGGFEGITIDKIDVEYARGNSTTVAPTTGWITDAPPLAEGPYLWSRVKLTFMDGEVKYSGESYVQANKGADGADGIDGLPGPAGQATYTWVMYADSDAGAGMNQYPTGKKYIGFAHNKTTPTESSDPLLYKWSRIEGAAGQKGEVGADGTQYYFWLKYADTPTTGMSDDPAGKKYMGIAVNKTTDVESTVYSDYKWQLTKGSDGADGTDGIQGPAGEDGLTTYTWVRYADTATGVGISQYPAGKDYIGMAYNKTTGTESSDPSLYKWSLIKGTAGQKGDVGEDGVQLYNWLKYADDAVGGGMSDLPDGKKYMGIAVNKLTEEESDNYLDYKWQLTKGIGIDTISEQYYTSTSATALEGGAWSEAVPTPANNIYVWTRTVITFDQGGGETITQPLMATGFHGKDGTGIALKESVASYSSLPATGNTVGDARLARDSGRLYIWDGALPWKDAGPFKGDTGQPGPPGIKGDTGASGVTTYTWVRYADSSTGAGMSQFPAGKLYIGFAYNKTTSTESNVASQYAWSLIKGTDGQPGAKGDQGEQLYNWIKYADSPTTGMSDSPVGKKYLGLAVNKPTEQESTNYNDYSWQLTKGDKGEDGADGTDGIQGPPGQDGLTTYTWVRYADTEVGGGMKQHPTGKKYIGFAYNKNTATESSVATDYKWSLIAGTDGQPGAKGADGVQLYFWIKYADTPTSGMNDSPVGKKYMGIAVNKTTSQESTIYTDYSWQLVQGPPGADGIDGIRGPAGIDGVSSYTWVRYADNASGGGLTQYPTGKLYIGFAYNKTTKTESNTASDYKWSLIKGTDGQPGAKGADGVQLYNWLKYADTPTTGMSDDPTGKKYMGLAVNKITATESTLYSDYTWQLTKGEDGMSPYIGVNGNWYIWDANRVPTPGYIDSGDSAIPDAGKAPRINGSGIWEVWDHVSEVWTSTGVTAQGPKGDKGATGTRGPEGASGVGISSIVEYYLISSVSTGVTTATAGWTTGFQQMTPAKKYLWNYERIYFTDGSNQPTIPVVIGVYGDTGNTGNTGQTGATGRSITGISERYLISSASTAVTRSTPGWQTTMQLTTPAKRYLWNYEIITWNSAPITTYVEPIIIGVHGDSGDDGVDSISVVITKQGAFKVVWNQYDTSGNLLGFPESAVSVIGGVNINGVDYVQCKIVVRKGVTDITSSVFADPTFAPKWYVNNNLQSGQITPILNLRASIFANGVDDEVRFEYNDVNMINW